MFSVLSGADILIERKLKSDEKLNVQTQKGGMLKMKINHKRKYFKMEQNFLIKFAMKFQIALDPVN